MMSEVAGKDRDADTIADLQAKFMVVQAEAARASMQRDYFIRLLRQQQTSGAASTQNAFLSEESRVFALTIKFMPQRLKVMIPLRAKQFLKDIIIRIG